MNERKFVTKFLTLILKVYGFSILYLSNFTEIDFQGELNIFCKINYILQKEFFFSKLMSLFIDFNSPSSNSVTKEGTRLERLQ